MNHTKGKWHRIPNTLLVVPEDEPDIEMVGPCVIANCASQYISTKECEANADLVAAAPELLKVLKEMVRMAAVRLDIRATAINVINKAEGKIL